MCKLKYFHMSDIYVSYIHLYTIYSLYISNIHDNTNYYTHIRIYIFYLQAASNKVCVFAQTYIQQQSKPNTDVAHFTSHTIQHSRKRVSDLYIYKFKLVAFIIHELYQLTISILLATLHQPNIHE